MPLQKSSRHALPVQDVPVNVDLRALHTASPSSQSRLLESGSQITMPSLAGCTADIVSDYCFNTEPYQEDGLFASKPLPWQEVQEPSRPQQEPNPYRLTQESLEHHFDNAFGGSCAEKPTEDSVWDYGYIHRPVTPHTSSMRPRNYPSERGVHSRESIQPQKEPQRTTSFLLDSYQQPSHQTMLANLRLQRHRDTLANPTNICQVPFDDETYQNACSTSSHYSMDPSNFDMSSANSPGTIAGQELVNDVLVTNGEDSDGDGNSNSEPYAQLIFRALKSAPGHRMVLKEIYEWFAKNTDKAKTSSSKGWQNSIRHNLSMNGVRYDAGMVLLAIADAKQAFKKVDQAPPSEETKKGFVWVLEPTAVDEGVKSTTRYRKFNSNRKIGKADNPAPQRQRSGAKGGKAAKKAAKIRRSARFTAPSVLRYVEEARVASPTTSVSTTDNTSQMISDVGLAHPTEMPYYLSTPTLSSQSSTLDSKSYGFEEIAGCSPHICDQLFYEDPDHINNPILSYPPFCDSGDNIFTYGLAV